MTLNFKKHKEELLFVPLGGAGEIGMNLNLYHLDGKWLMADFGAGFAEDFMPGVDMIVPDISFIQEHKKDLLGCVLTHAHEDHLGAIAYMWDQFSCPIYATPFTANFLRAKINDSDLEKKNIKIIEVQCNSTFDIGPFNLELVQITHSVPEMNAVMLRTRYGNVFHSGDWKLDPDPVVGPSTDEDYLQKLGDDGILAYVGDSTNVFSPGTSGSEGDIIEHMTKLIQDSDQMVLVTTFASNVARIETIAKAAQAAGRKIMLAGRSLWRITNVAKESGYLTDIKEPFLDTDQFKNVARDKLVVLSTGCQGEPLAATNKIVNGSHRDISIKPGDTVIFSSKIIPGNEKRIYRLFNKFAERDVKLFHEKNAKVHVSGHPNQDELKRMYELLRPEISVPVHGELIHMKQHGRLAKDVGIEHACQVVNGDVLRLAPGKPEKLSVVTSGLLGIDGNFFLSPDSAIMRTRRKVQREGLIVVTLIIDDTGLFMEPIINAPGVIDAREDKDIFEALYEEVDVVLDEYFASTKKKRRKRSTIEQMTRSAIRRIIKREAGKNPVIEVNIRDLDA